MKQTTEKERKDAALRGEAVNCSTYRDELCVCRGALYPGTVVTCTRRREHERQIKAVDFK